MFSLYLNEMKNIYHFFFLLYAQLTGHTTRNRILLKLEIIYPGLETLLLYFNRKTTLIISLVIQELRLLVTLRNRHTHDRHPTILTRTHYENMPIQIY